MTIQRFCTYALGLALPLLAAGCQDDELFTRKPLVEEGIPTQVRMNFAVDANQVITREAQDEESEFRVENIYLFIFDSNGQRIPTTNSNDEPMTFFTAGGGGLSVTNGDSTTPTAGSFSFTAQSVNDARIVGVANLTEGNTSTAYTVTKAQLDDIETLDELQQLILPMTQSESIERGGLFLMTGYAEDETGNNNVTITAPEGNEVTTLDDYTLLLRRVDAKVEVHVKAEVPQGKNWTNFTFTPGEWQVMSVPSQSLLLPVEKEGINGPWQDAEAINWDASDDASCQYFTSRAVVFENLTQDENTNLGNGGSFVFYMPENRKRFKQSITETDPTKAYALRDEREHDALPEGGSNKPGQEFENGAFAYANGQSTYLYFTGHLSYTDENNNDLNADVRCTVHLGYASKDANDYDTKRNGHYVYNITVLGVDDIIVEVTNTNDNEQENRPGYEGDVIYSANQIYNLDSHYDRCVVEIPVNEIDDAITWSVKTPFSNGMHDASRTDVEPELKDYKWIKFAINAQYGFGQGQYVKYPGDQNYDNPDKSGDGVESPYYQTYQGGRYRNARLMDIQQLLEYLKQAKKDRTLSSLMPNGVTDRICVTAFVDENLYYEDPMHPENGIQLELWKKSVDQNDRQLHIITSGATYSPDGNSSVVNSLYTFTQKAIRTVYNVSKEELTTAWGLESIMETDRLNPGNVRSGSSTSNGRQNTMAWIGDGTLAWTSVLNTSARYGLNTNYNNAAYACMMRNRDLDGDNRIDNNEVRWYLAAIDQLVDIYLGEYALDQDSRLYPENASDRPGGRSVYWHYTSSSYDDSQNGPWVLWAEEGASIGNYNSSSGNQYNGANYSYRCIRNLGINLNSPDTEPEPLIDYTGDGTESSPYRFDLSNMNEKSLRSYLVTGATLPNHNEQSANNRPYTYFEVYWEDTPQPNRGYIYYNFNNAQNWEYYQTYGQWPNGYRMPNMRELLIMTTRLPESAWPTYHTGAFGEYSRPSFYISQTAFSMRGQNPYTGDRKGYVMGTNNFGLGVQNSDGDRGYVRCIKDIENL